MSKNLAISDVKNRNACRNALVSKVYSWRSPAETKNDQAISHRGNPGTTVGAISKHQNLRQLLILSTSGTRHGPRKSSGNDGTGWNHHGQDCSSYVLLWIVRMIEILHGDLGKVSSRQALNVKKAQTCRNSDFMLGCWEPSTSQHLQLRLGLRWKFMVILKFQSQPLTGGQVICIERTLYTSPKHRTENITSTKSQSPDYLTFTAASHSSNPYPLSASISFYKLSPRDQVLAPNWNTHPGHRCHWPTCSPFWHRPSAPRPGSPDRSWLWSSSAPNQGRQRPLWRCRPGVWSMVLCHLHWHLTSRRSHLGHRRYQGDMTGVWTKVRRKMRCQWHLPTVFM